MNLLPLGVAAALSMSCQGIKKAASSPNLDSPAVSVRVGEGCASGIYRYDFESGEVAQLVSIEPTPDLIKYAFTRDGEQTQIYLVGDGASGRNLYRAIVPSDGSVTASLEKILGDNDLNGPAVCDEGASLVVGQLLPNSVQVQRVPLPVATGATVAFSRPNFLAGDLHCRAGVEGFFFSGFECPENGNLGQCLGSGDSVTSVYHMVNGSAVPVTAPEQDADVAALPRPKLHHRGDVDATAAPLSDGRIVLGFGRLFNSPRLAEPDAPASKRDNGYHKLMLTALAPGATAPSTESEIDIPSLFRQHWQLPQEKTIDFVLSTVDLREGAPSTSSVEFIVAASVEPRGVDDEEGKFNGLVYGRVPLSEIGKAKAALTEMRGLLTMVQLSCGIWRAKGLGDPDGKVYLYGAVFPRFIDEDSSVMYFSTIRGTIGSYLAANGGAIKLQDGTEVPAAGFLQAFCPT